MSSSSQFETKFQAKSTHLGEASSHSHDNLEPRRKLGSDGPYKRPKTVLFNDRHWLYIQRRYHMSPRELQIAKLICQGLRNDDIAKNLHITLGTVKTHIRNIYRRVQVESKIAMLLRFVADARELFAQYDQTHLVPAVDLAKPAKIIPAS